MSFLLLLHTKIFSGSIVKNFLLSFLFQAFLFRAIKMQSSMVLWAMVNHWPISIVKILNICSARLFEEELSFPALLINRYLELLYVGIQRFSPICLGIPGVWMMLWLLFELRAIQCMYFLFFKTCSCKGWVKCWMRVLISFKPLVEQLAIQKIQSAFQ